MGVMAIRTSEYGPSELKQLLAKLERAAVAVREAIEWCEESGTGLYVFKRASQVDAMRRFAGFEQELSDSLIAAKSGQPFGPDTLKSSAKASPSKATAKKKVPKVPGVRTVTDEELKESESRAAEEEREKRDGPVTSPVGGKKRKPSTPSKETLKAAARKKSTGRKAAGE